MAKQFLTAQDVELYCAEGVRELPANNDVVVTDLARERARELGIRIVPDSSAEPLTPPARAETGDRPSSRPSAQTAAASNSPAGGHNQGGGAGTQLSPAELKTAIVAALRQEGIEPPRNLDEIIRRVREA